MREARHSIATPRQVKVNKFKNKTNRDDLQELNSGHSEENTTPAAITLVPPRERVEP